MTQEEADQRIILSRQTLFGYRNMAANDIWPVSDMHLIAQELDLLNGIAAQHGNMGMKLVRLVADWVSFQDALKTKMN